MVDVTRILSEMESGDGSSSDLLPLVYEELRKLAMVRLSQEKPGHTLQATALVHEAYLRLVGNGQRQTWKSRGHFFGAAAEAIRRILVEAARRKHALKRGGGAERVELELVIPAMDGMDTDLLALDEALGEFAEKEPSKAELVKLRYFGGLTLDESAAALGISTATADRHWRYARAWLAARLRDGDDSDRRSKNS